MLCQKCETERSVGRLFAILKHLFQVPLLSSSLSKRRRSVPTHFSSLWSWCSETSTLIGRRSYPGRIIIVLLYRDHRLPARKMVVSLPGGWSSPCPEDGRSHGFFSSNLQTLRLQPPVPLSFPSRSFHIFSFPATNDMNVFYLLFLLVMGVRSQVSLYISHAEMNRTLGKSSSSKKRHPLL